ncbi:hypothetical protein G4O51_04540 [Candidatus Bathyarchaeota archaeon A05DMB-2]|jgi:prefoldin subunit 5|nr:hypothetical protein [Candidatus Bathyarchaeota archaeon A05DMB-2]
MALQETAQKAYARYGSDAEKTYKARRFSIRQRLSHTTASQLQRHLSDLDEEIADLKNENAQLKVWIRQIKREGSVNAYLDHMHRTLAESHLGMLELRLDANKTALGWMRRERRIYAWALRLRKAKGLVKLPFLKARKSALEREAEQLQSRIAELDAQLQDLRTAHEKTRCEHAGVEREIQLLSV